MATPLNILIVEDSQDDADLIVAELRRGGFDPKWKRVEKEAEFMAEMIKLPDVILSDYSMPDFSGLKAAKLLQESGLDIPFILISGTVGEEIAVEAMKRGATDYLLKDRIARLGTAVQRALEQQQLRQQRQRAEEALRRTEARFQTIVENLAEGLVVSDLSGQILHFNQAALDLHGFASLEECRRHFSKFADTFEISGMDGKVWPVDQWPLARILRGEKLQNLEARIRRVQNGWQRIFNYGGALVREAGGPPIMAVVTISDITERLNLQAQFIEAQKMEVIGHLAGGVTHDFNNVLSVILSYSDMLLEKVTDPEMKKDLEVMQHAAERAAGLTRQLLVFSRKQTVQPVVINLGGVVSGMEKMLRRLIDENVELTFTLDQETGRISADSGYIGQVLMNLVVNARDAMPSGGKLAVTTGNVALDDHYARLHKGVTPGNYVMFSVSDSGSGMSDEVKAHLFEAFYTTKPKGKGTGLGLTTCQTIVQQSGGHIDVASEIGKGTTFKVYFPRVDLPLAAAAGSAQKGPLPRGAEAVLVVEDDPGVRHLACKVLKKQGYEVLTAMNGQDALQVARSHQGSPLRLVITDVIMPQMSGMVMAEWLKSSYPDLKILFTSGYTDDTISHHGMLDSGAAFLPKPYTPLTLTRKVREVLDGPKAAAGA